MPAMPDSPMADKPPAPAPGRFLRTLLLAPFAPRRVLRLWPGTALKPALGIHLAALLLFCAVHVVFGQLSREFPDRFLLNLPSQILAYYMVHGIDEFLITVGAVLVVGAACAVALTLGALPWAWANERFATLTRSTLRTVLLLSTGWLLPKVVFHALALTLSYVFSPTALDGSMQSYERTLTIPAAIAFLGLLWPVWSLWIVWRGVTAERPYQPVMRTATCERCGYDLSYLPAGDCCPECGYALSGSLESGHRSACSWEAPAGRGRAAAFWQCGGDALRRPERFFLPLALDSSPRRALRFVIVAIGLIGLEVALVVGAFTLFVEDTFLWRNYLVLLTGIGNFLWTLLVIWTAIAAGVGLISSAVCRRNLVGPVGRIAAYTAGWLVVGAAVAIVLGLALFLYLDKARPPQKLGSLCVMIWLALVALVPMIHVLLIARRVRYVRYVNFDDGLIAPVRAGVRSA